MYSGVPTGAVPGGQPRGGRPPPLRLLALRCALPTATTASLLCLHSLCHHKRVRQGSCVSASVQLVLLHAPQLRTRPPYVPVPAVLSASYNFFLRRGRRWPAQVRGVPFRPTGAGPHARAAVPVRMRFPAPFITRFVSSSSAGAGLRKCVGSPWRRRSSRLRSCTAIKQSLIVLSTFAAIKR